MVKKPITYYDETWQQWFIFLESWDLKDAKKVLRKMNIPENEVGDFFHGKTLMLDTGAILVWTTSFPKNSAKRYTILAHECLHAAHYCLRKCGVRADFDNDEAVAYLLTVLMRKALKDI